MGLIIAALIGLCAGAFLDHHFSGKIDAILTRVEAAVKGLKG